MRLSRDWWAVLLALLAVTLIKMGLVAGELALEECLGIVAFHLQHAVRRNIAEDRSVTRGSKLACGITK